MCLSLLAIESVESMSSSLPQSTSKTAAAVDSHNVAGEKHVQNCMQNSGPV